MVTGENYKGHEFIMIYSWLLDINFFIPNNIVLNPYYQKIFSVIPHPLNYCFSNLLAQSDITLPRFPVVFVEVDFIPTIHRYYL